MMAIVAMFAGVGLSWVAFWFLVRVSGGQYRPSQELRPKILGALAAVAAFGCLIYAGSSVTHGGGDDAGICGSGPTSYDC